ncbi:carbohydrate ABC transporter permease [Listeria booriae]|uniref:Sugar ABC transporter permease n=1 Tax=Listeria booriae TaxID=1552123 RepID=A0A7X0YS52_9LIST|nr:sugar ABC transporter permease [Listeria booriae]MBC1225850.1 sugar ABC transporter permease [Listeria booriae]MBC1229340.1 sugar ABC transporter permease [Listeria booriae]MBC1232533.1 sugar ABC transporter permease [Listeria booriae]MBC1246480.1 sugar ABC transporter permease [Listeria booriae]MBC1284526.1 sugar ABC transporter permease [Listeria booriae]
MEANAKTITYKKRNWRFTPWLFAGPHLIIFLIFFLVPVVYGIYISFTDWDLVGTPDFVGFDNYREILFQKDSTFYEQLHNGLRNTFIFVVLTVPFCIIVPLLLASALNAKPKLNKLFQSLFYLPSLFAISAVIIIWGLMFNVSFGPINQFLGTTVNWVGTQPYAWLTLVIVTVWWCIGGNMIIYQAALNGISKDFYEAADIDGATSMQKFFRITLPSIRAQLLYTVVMTTIAQFNVYGQPLMLTKGGPSGSTSVLLMYIQQNAFGTGQSIAGIASAMAVILGLCIMAVSAVQFFFLRNKN